MHGRDAATALVPVTPVISTFLIKLFEKSLILVTIDSTTTTDSAATVPSTADLVVMADHSAVLVLTGVVEQIILTLLIFKMVLEWECMEWEDTVEEDIPMAVAVLETATLVAAIITTATRTGAKLLLLKDIFVI